MTTKTIGRDLPRQTWAAYPVSVELVDPPAPPALVWEGDYA